MIGDTSHTEHPEKLVNCKGLVKRHLLRPEAAAEKKHLHHFAGGSVSLEPEVQASAALKARSSLQTAGWEMCLLLTR